ncbi:DNA-binding response regulator [Pseudomonas putida]|uniref:response regulator transcription factor n=1 Tax=Pseudomonas putida TaxID=303 RepID=UPI001E5B6347|nr:DNA-binding response regulator [Pseudomonas putida]
MVVDDVDSERMLLADYLQQQGCRVYLANNGQDAIKKIRLINPDLVLMDILMPICDGLTCCRIMQSSVETRAIPVIFLTGAGMPDQRVQGLLAGAVDYIVKPFRLEEVRLRLVVHLRRTGISDVDQEPMNPKVRNLDSILFQTARNFLVSNLSSSPELAELAARVGTNSKRLNEAFRQCVGVTVFEFLREERMKEACRLLSSTGLTAQAIGLEVGYTSGANFSTAFRERYGMTPNQYRQARMNLVV